MGVSRRALLGGGMAAVGLSAGGARAQAYPTRVIKIVVGFAAGGSTDVAARLIGQALSERLGQPVVIENRPGAASNLATQAVTASPPDGYTLLAASASNTVNAALSASASYNFATEIRLVSGVLRSPLVLVVHPKFPAKTVAELIAAVKAQPGKINLASFGTGSSSHVSGELFKIMAGLDMPHVPYRGSAPMVNDLLAGHVSAGVDNLPASIEFIRTGQLRALGVTTAARWPTLSDVPTIGETVPGFEASSWIALGVPSRTPADIASRLAQETARVLKDPAVAAKITQIGAAPFEAGPDEMKQLVTTEIEKWERVVRTANLKPE